MIRIDRRYEIWVTDDVELPECLGIDDIAEYESVADVFIYRLHGEERQRTLLLTEILQCDTPLRPADIFVEEIEESVE